MLFWTVYDTFTRCNLGHSFDEISSVSASLLPRFLSRFAVLLFHSLNTIVEFSSP